MITITELSIEQKTKCHSSEIKSTKPWMDGWMDWIMTIGMSWMKKKKKKKQMKNENTNNTLPERMSHRQQCCSHSDKILIRIFLRIPFWSIISMHFRKLQIYTVQCIYSVHIVWPMKFYINKAKCWMNER